MFNIVTGDAPAIGAELCANPAVRKLSFTGSTEVGRILMRQSADTIKKLSLELGGNAPFIVFDDADLDAAVEGALASKYRNAGQTCVCANRLYVQDGVYDAFAAKLTEKVRAFKVGEGTEPNVVIGPLIDEQGMKKVESHVADALGKGAKAVLGGKRHERGGLFFQPTVLTGVTPEMLVSHEETFGPVAPLIRFKTRGRGREAGQRQRVRPFRLLLQPRRRTGVSRRRADGDRHRRRERRHHLHGSRPLRRVQQSELAAKGPVGIEEYSSDSTSCRGLQ